jgi:hypothetical protein
MTCGKNSATFGSRLRVNSIRGETVALDTNVFIFALRKEANHPACETLLFDKLNELHVYMPLQIFVELQLGHWVQPAPQGSASNSTEE